MSWSKNYNKSLRVINFENGSDANKNMYALYDTVLQMVIDTGTKQQMMSLKSGMTRYYNCDGGILIKKI